MIVVLIPAYEPPATLPALCARLAGDARVAAIIVVDDGSAGEGRAVLDALAAGPGVHVIRHQRNRGKGAAIKTGLRYVLDSLTVATTIVTADADGQHLPDDILRIASMSLAAPGSLVLGVRTVGEEAPARSRFGNGLTRAVYRVLVGQRLDDTQSGLRAFSRDLAGLLLQVPGETYEYELNVLISCRQAHVPVVQERIATVYLDGNRASHFKPLRDSLRVYAVLLGFTAVSLATAVIDNALVIAALSAGAGGAQAFLGARLVSALVNYQLVRRLVFPGTRIGGGEGRNAFLPGSDPLAGTATGAPRGQTPSSVRRPPDRVVRRYVTLVILNVLVGQAGVSLLQAAAGLTFAAAKVVMETALFLPNFLLQRDVVFRTPPRSTGATDWAAYHASVPITARLTRRYSSRVLSRMLGSAVAVSGPARHVIELGGGGSCFVSRICGALRPDTYTIVDKEPQGLSRLAGWTPPPASATRLETHRADAREFRPAGDADVVFSVGLIEHFDAQETGRLVRAHFDMVRRGGVVLVSYPTPTALYRATRRVLEYLGLWGFPDERPLRYTEIARTAGELGEPIATRILWPMLLTQQVAVFRRR